MFADQEEKAARCHAEDGKGYGEGVWTCAELGREHLGSVGDRFIVDLGLHRVCGNFLNL